MKNLLVSTAFQLYVDTLELETTDINTQSAKWHDLYSKECQLFNMMRQMNWEELEEYKHIVRIYNIDNNISNEVNWEDDNKNY